MDKRLKRIAIYVAVGILVLLIIAGIYIYFKDPSYFDVFVKKYGYIGLAVAVFVTNASVFVGIPTPTYIFMAVAAGLNPIIVTIIAAAASALGESTGYFIGLGGKKVIERKYAHIIREWRRLFKKHAFLTVVVIAALPFPPDDFAGIIAGSLGYDFRMFLLATFIGKAVKYGATAVLTITGIKIYNHVFYD